MFFFGSGEGSQCVRLSVCLLLTPLLLPLVGKVRNCLWKTLEDVIISDACPGSSTKGSKTIACMKKKK